MTWTGTFWSSWAWLLLASASLWLGSSQRASAANLDPALPTLSGCLHFVRSDTDMEAAAVGSAVYWGLKPVDLIVRIVTEGELNQEWNLNVTGALGEIGLGQVRPITVCQMLGRCGKKPPHDQQELDRIAQWLRPYRMNLCWTGKLLAHLMVECRGQAMCALVIYNGGDRGLGYAKRVTD